MKTATATPGLGELVVRPGKDLVAASLEELRAALREAVVQRPALLTIDLSGVEMIDSTGIGLLIATHNSLRQRSGTLALIHASREILGLFRSLRLHQHFSISGE